MAEDNKKDNKKLIYTLISILISTGFDVSPLENWLLSIILWAISLALFIFIAIPRIDKEWSNIKQSPFLLIFIIICTNCITIVVVNWLHNDNVSPSPVSQRELTIHPLPHCTSTSYNIYSSSTHTELIPVFTKDMETIYAKSGSMTKKGKFIPLIRVGDLTTNKAVIAFIGFEIKKVPRNIKIAELHLSIDTYHGNMDWGHFNSLIIEAVDIGDTLDKDDAIKGGIYPEDKIFVSYDEIINEKVINVTKEIQVFKKRGREYAVFRLEFLGGSDGNNATDLLTFKHDCFATILKLEYDD